MKLKTISILCCIFLFLHDKICSQSNALRFDGTNDYVQRPSQVNVGTGNFTFEAWVKPETTTNGVVFGQDISGNNNHMFRLTVQNNRARFYFRGATTNPNIQIATAAGSVPTNVWTHLAVVRNGGDVTIYVNGVAGATGNTATINNQSGADPTKPFRIGARGGTSNANGQTNFEGSIDDFRYWNIARSQSDIRSNMFYPPSAGATGLVSWYKFDAGSGTSAVNSGTNSPGNNGTLVNGPAWVTSPIVYSQNAIHLDGTNDDIAIGTPLPTGSSFTKEAWVYATTTSGSLNILSTNGSPFWINNGHLKAGIGSNIDVISDPGNFPVNTWTHVAVTFHNPSNTMRLYRDGNLVATNTSVTANYTGESMYIGSWQGSMSFFEGRLDEVRIWNVARTASEIQNNRNLEISPSGEANLVAYYTFNQGIVNGTNTGLTTVIDQKGSFNGTLDNFSLSGTSSNFVAQYASLAVLPLRWKSFTASRKGDNVSLEWKTANEQNTTSFVVQRGDDVLRWADIGTLAAAGNASEERVYTFTDRSPVKGANYYRVMQKDIDGKYTYSEIKKVMFEGIAQSVVIKNNPVTNNTLELLVEKPVMLAIYNTQGSILFRKQLPQGLQRVNISGLPGGIYIARAGDKVMKILIN
ncbi:MAG: hypothetical protein JNK79_12545 [Chitinophagaceae bacterium]|nr:hypothetical protein [Chitinophagaceae bacterium]